MITFKVLRDANRARLPEFKNANGVFAHDPDQPNRALVDGSDWSPAQWLQALVGELGEYANLRKKWERGDITHAQFYAAASDELADVATYLDILADRLNIDLGAAVVSKFNRISVRAGSTVFIGMDGEVFRKLGSKAE